MTDRDPLLDELDAIVNPLAASSHYAIPYPASSDPVSAGAANMQAIAEQVDRALGFIAQQTLAAAAASIVFSSIPATYLDLILYVWGRQDTGTSGSTYMALRCNGDTGATAYFNGITNTAGAAFGIGGPFVTDHTLGAAANIWCVKFEVLDYLNATQVRNLRGESGGPAVTQTGAGGGQMGGAWMNSAAAVNSLTAFLTGGNFKAGAKARLYGRM